MKNIIALLFFIILLSSCADTDSSNKINLKVFPGYGVLINMDSVLLGKTNVEDLNKLFKIDTIKNSGLILWDGIDPETGELAGGSLYEAEYSFSGIHFKFTDENDPTKMSLNFIFTENLQDFNATLNSINLNKSNLDIKKIFPHRKKYDYISHDELYYSLRSCGISISLKKIDDDLFINYLQISPKLIK